MPRPFLPAACLAACLVLAACAQLPLAPTVAPSAPAVAVGVQGEAPKAKVVVTGTAKGPRAIVSRVLPTGGGHVIPVGGGHVIPTGGGNAPTGFAVLAVGEAPLTQAKVFLADAAGQPYPSLEAVTTDAEGRFTFPAVPAGHTFMVVVEAYDTVRAKDVTLQTLVEATDLGASTAVDTATSLVTLAVTEGQGGALGELNPAAFRTATEATARHLMEADLPDFGDRSAVLAKVASLESSIAELKSALEQIRQELKDLKASIEELKTAVANRPLPPPPNTNGTGARAGDCAGRGSFTFTLKGTYEGYPLRVDFVSPYGHHMAQLVFSEPGAAPSAMVPFGCPHAVTLRDAAGKTLATDPAFAVQLGAGTKVELPF